MATWLAILLVVGNTVVCLRRPRVGVALYALLALTAPHAAVAGVKLQYEIAALPFVLPAFFFGTPRFRRGRRYGFLGAYLVLITASTIVSLLKYNASVEWIRYAGQVRWLVLIALFVECLDRRWVEVVFLGALLINVVVAVVQVASPETVDVFLQLYGRESQGVLQRYASQGTISRAMGTMESPVNLGALSLLGFALGSARLLRRGRERVAWTLIVASVVCGLVSLTKTFYLGAPLLVIVILFLGLLPTHLTEYVRPGRISRLSVNGLIAVALAAGIAYGAVWLRRMGLSVTYYASFLFSPREAFATRYDEAGGVLATTLDVIADNWLLGVGMTTPAEEFIGDSAYVVLLHHGGLVGLALFVAGLAALLRQIVRYRRWFDLVVLAGLVVAGVGVPLVFYLMGALTVAYLLSNEHFDAMGMNKRLLEREVSVG